MNCLSREWSHCTEINAEETKLRESNVIEFHFVMVNREGSAPNDSAAPKKEMAAATDLSPHRWMQSYVTVWLLPPIPTRTRVWKAAQLDRRPATAGARHHRLPNRLIFTNQVDFPWVQIRGNVVNDNGLPTPTERPAGP